MADPKVINYAGEQKIYNKEKVDELLDTKQDTLVPDVVVQDSVNVVTNSAVKAYVDTETLRAESAEGDLTDLKTTDKSNLVAAINEVKDSAYTVDEHVTAGSTNPVQNTGVKEYVDAQDKAALQSAKDYTDNKIGELEPGDGTTVVELTGHLGDLKNAAESLVTAINNIDDHVEQNSLGIGALETSLNQESAARIAGDQALDTKITQVEQALDTKITQVEQAKQDKLTFDDIPTNGSDNPVTSAGIYKAIRKAGVKIGEIMDWPQFKTETRTMISDNPFEFTFNGLVHNVAVEPKDVEFEIADNVPEGWKAMDGSVELDAATNQELADFFGGRNTTTDGKIWIPYLPRKIIKVAY